MLLLTVDPLAPVPIYRQICDRIVALVDEGALRPGDRLPATRALAASLGVHRSTVVRAYDEVRALGYLDSRAGSYSTVRRRARPPATRAGARAGAGLVDWSVLATPGAGAVHAYGAPGPESAAVTAQVPADMIDFERLAADPSLAPDDDLLRCLRTVLARGTNRPRGAALDYAAPAGYRPLREALAARLCTHGVAVSSEEILITSGAQHAFDLALRLLVQRGDRVVVEAPTYGMAHALMRLHGVTPIEVPLRADGMDLDALARALRRRRPRLVYTMPNFHNPTGVTTGHAHRERLLALCEAQRVPIVEDGFEEELKYFGHAVLPIKSMDAHGIVLYVGTFSKVVFPGLRVGWIAAPREAVARLAAIQHASCLAGNTLAQAALARFCAGGTFDDWLRRAHRVYRKRMQALLRGLEQHMPPGVHWTRPTGGYTLWLTLPGVAEAEASLCDRFARAGVKVAPGSRFFARPPATRHVRLSIACVAEERIEEGCQRLARALARVPCRLPGPPRAR